jgi:hypothetical protein
MTPHAIWIAVTYLYKNTVCTILVQIVEAALAQAHRFSKEIS